MRSKELCEEEKNAREGEGSVKVVCDHEKIKILVDPMRRKILHTMREGIENEDGNVRKEMTVPEIARKLGVTAPKCYHHLDLLVENGFVRVAREEKKKRTSITYYERTAPAFVLASSIDEIEKEAGLQTQPLIAIITDGFKLKLIENQQAEAQKIIEELNNRSHAFMVKVAQQVKGIIPDEKAGTTLRFVSDLLISQDKKCQDLRKELLKYIILNIKME